ncbi:FAD-dependent oxidoreductase [Salinibacterium sp.]|uniref:FAD-dependent oxidoreductase n=1 Tax=Salinibacterium sp. TaxID=1915057 RepID=UPI0037CC9D3B
MVTVLVVGGVAGGMSAATRLRRLDESANIVIFERGPYVSFANCGLPYYVGGVIEERGSLLLQTPAVLAARFRLDVRVSTEVVAINRPERTVEFRNVITGETGTETYDHVVLAAGAIAVPVGGPSSRALSLRTIDDVDAITAVLDGAGDAPTAVVVGGGFIGLEAVDNLVRRGIHTSLIQRGGQLFSPLDHEMSNLVLAEVQAHGVDVFLGRTVADITDESVLLDDGTEIDADLVIDAAGVHPAVDLATAAGLRLGSTGGIAVDELHHTSDPRIFAVGDGVEKTDAVDGHPTLVTMAGLANRHGRAVADAIAGQPAAAIPALGTAIIGVFDKTVAVVGWSEKKLVAAGRAHRVIHTHPASHATYYPGAEIMAIKLLVDPARDTILGAQIIGGHGVDKRIDVIATAMSAGLTASALKDLELAYAPQYGSAKDPINLIGYVADNLRRAPGSSVQWHELADRMADGAVLVDVRSPAEHRAGHIPGAISMPLEQLRKRHGELEGQALIVHCQVGQRGHTATSMLSQLGHNVRNLDGGYVTWLAATRPAKGRTS